MKALEQIAHMTRHDARAMIHALCVTFGVECVLEVLVERTREIHVHYQVPPVLQDRNWSVLRSMIEP